ncbi:MAG: NUDIX domain-containing protein [Flavobacteriaceae bacterium]|jgi:ADP-ribose pyrophosphatase YjhB (NUDIX family)|nr:NUDIX domain-containing protein [Flavobacteriaceae bacterium]
MYKISVNEKLLTIGKKGVKDAVNIFYDKQNTFDYAFDILYNTKVRAVHIFSLDEKHIWKKLQKYAPPVYAAGGIVKNSSGKYLFIKRNGIWDLPKGHVEKKETFKETALREVEEECAISGIKLEKYLSTTYHIYLDKQYRLKVVQWFMMNYSGKEKPRPQTEEGIELVKWVYKKEIPHLMENAHNNIKTLVSKHVLK